MITELKDYMARATLTIDHDDSVEILHGTYCGPFGWRVTYIESILNTTEVK